MSKTSAATNLSHRLMFPQTEAELNTHYELQMFEVRKTHKNYLEIKMHRVIKGLQGGRE